MADTKIYLQNKKQIIVKPIHLLLCLFQKKMFLETTEGFES